MIEPIRTLFRWRIAGKSRQASSSARIGQVRLHAELLEGRLLMAADSTASGSEILDALATQNSNEVLVAVAALTSQDVATATVTASQVTEDHWAQFGSKAAFEAWLVETAIAQYGNMFGQRGYSWWHYGMPHIAWDSAVLLNNALVRASTDFSATNLQEASVDEADLIETDGSYLYIISGEDLVIVQAGVGDELQVVSRVHIGGRPGGMFLSGDRLAIVSDTSQYDYFGDGLRRVVANDSIYSFNSTSLKTTVTILNIGDRTDPSMVQKSEMDGPLVASRVVGGELRLVLSNDFRLPPPISKPIANGLPIADKVYLSEDQPMMTFGFATDVWYPNAYGQEYVYETQEEYLERVRDTILDRLLPRVRNLTLDGKVLSERELVDVARLYRPESLSDFSITTIATFNMASNRRGPVATESVFTNGAPQVYATEDSFYLFSQKPYEWSSNSYTPSTRIWKFDFEGGRNGIKIAARGTVEGTVLNQFAADEENGFLRVVTENWATSDNGLHVLQQVGKRLEVIGSIDGIASGERLFSVRFLADRAFFVTFRQVDPLFAVDLSNPTNPQLLGELHIPGYSDYLQPIDDNHLIAIGRGADESTGQFQELQVSIFDVSDLANPRLVHRYSFEGGRTTATPATGDRWTRGDGDHHAVGYFAEEQILTLPISTEHDWSTENGSLFAPGEGGLQVFKIDVQAGFTSLGIIEHDTLVNRSVRIGDRLFAISSGTVSVHELDNPTTRLGEVSIAAPPSAPMFGETPALVEDPRFIRIRPLILEPVSPLPLESESQLAAVWNESPASPPDSEPAAESIPTPLVGWASPSQAHARRAQPTISARETPLSIHARVDAQLLDLLATQSARLQSNLDPAIFELSGHSNSLNDPNADSHGIESPLSFSAFEVLEHEL